eukprot:1136713-Pelagomonas_calceolata.AAC.7
MFNPSHKAGPTWQLSSWAADTAACSCAMVQSLAARLCSHVRSRLSSMLRTTSSDSDLRGAHGHSMELMWLKKSATISAQRLKLHELQIQDTMGACAGI